MNLTEAKVQEELYQAKCEIAPRILELIKAHLHLQISFSVNAFFNCFYIILSKV